MCRWSRTGGPAIRSGRRSCRRGDRERRAARCADPRRHARAPRPERLARDAGGGDGGARGARGDCASLALRGAEAASRCRQRRSTSCVATSARAGEHERSLAMPRFAANLSMMYTEHAFLDRFAAAARRRLRGRRVPLPLRVAATRARRARSPTTACSRCSSTRRPATWLPASAASQRCPDARRSSAARSTSASSTPPRSAARACT